MKEKNDQKWVELALKGESQAYTFLVNRYKGMVYTLCYKMVQNRETAEELSMDTFLKAFRSLSGFRFESRFSSWLYRIAYTSCISHIRIKRIPTQDLTKYIEDQTSIQESFSLEFDRKYKKETILKALKLIPWEDSNLLYLYYLMEQSLSEIQNILDVPEETLKVRLFRARKKFKNALSECSYKVEI